MHCKRPRLDSWVRKIPWKRGKYWKAQYFGAFLVVQMVKNASWEAWVPFLRREDPLEEGMTTNSSIFAWRIPIDRGAWWAAIRGVTESDVTE